MSLTVTLTEPNGTVHTLTTAANALHGILLDSLDDLSQAVEDDAGQVDSGTFEITCRNEGHWWNTLLAGANPTARYPSTYLVTMQRDSVTRWVGDVDLTTVEYDRKGRTVSFVARGVLARLERYSAENVRRPFPTHSDWNNAMSSAPALASLTLTGDGGGAAAIAVDPDGLHAYVGTDDSPAKIIKVRLSDMSKVGSALTLAAGENNIQRLAIDDAGTYLYAVTYTAAAKVIKIDLATFAKVGDTLTLEAGEDNATGAAWDSVTQHLYVATNTAPLKIVKVAPGTTTPVRVAVITMTPAADEDYSRGLVLDEAAGYGYVSTLTSPANTVKFSLAGNMARVGVISLASGGSGENQATCAAIDVAGGYLYVGCYLSAARVVKVRLSDFSRLAVLTLSAGENQALSLSIDTLNGHLFVACNLAAGKIVKVQLSDFSRVSVCSLASGENYPVATTYVPSRGVVVAATDVDPVIVAMVYAKGMTEVYKVSDTDKAWPQDRFVRHVLVDNAAAVFQIVGNEATSCLVSAVPANQRYRIRAASFNAVIGTSTRRMKSHGPTVAELGLAVGDKLSFVSGTSEPSRVIRKATISTPYTRPFEVVEQTVAIQFIGPRTYNPTLAEDEIWVDEDLERDFTPGDGVILLTPYWRDTAASTLIADLFSEASVAVADYSVSLPTLDPATIPYADFGGMNVADALGKMAEATGCLLTSIAGQYVFVSRARAYADAGAGGSIDLVAQDWVERDYSEHSYDAVIVTGADERQVKRGLTGQLANKLEIECPWIESYESLAQVADILWGLYGGRRGSLDATILDGMRRNLCIDPSFEGLKAINAAGSQWRTNVAAALGETLEKSEARAKHLKHSLRISTTGTSGIGVKQLLYATGTVTASSSSGLLLTFTNDFESYSKVRFTTTGVLPAGLSAGVDYWTVRVGATTCRVATSLANAELGTVIAYSDAGTGTHTMTLQGPGLTLGEQVFLAAAALVVQRTKGTLHLDLYAKDSAGAVVLDSSGTYWTSATSGEFSKKSELVTVPAAATHVWVRVYWAGASALGEAYVDEVRVEPVTNKLAPAPLMRVWSGNNEYMLTSISESALSSQVPGVIELEGVGTEGVSLALVDDEEVDEAAIPTPQVSSAVASYDGSDTTFDCEVYWPYPDAEMEGLLWTYWTAASPRPDTGATTRANLVRSDATHFSLSFSVSGAVAANVKMLDVMLLRVDGELSSPSDPYLLPAP